MKNYLLLLFLILSISCNCEDKTDFFNEFVKKFKDCTFPITESTYQTLNLFANNPCNITKQEFDSFLKSNDDRFWIYRLYTKKHPNYFNYVTGIRFFLNTKKDLIALIYFRAYSTEEYAGGKTETILATFNIDGKVISSIPIAGGYGDSLSFNSKIYSTERIEVNYIKYTDKGEKKNTNYYSINKEGRIIALNTIMPTD